MDLRSQHTQPVMGFAGSCRVHMCDMNSLSIMELVNTKNAPHQQQLAVMCGARALLPPLLLRQM